MTLDGPPRELAGLINLLDPVIALLPRFGAAFVVLPLLKKTFVSRQLRVAFVVVMTLTAYPHMAHTISSQAWGAGAWMTFVLKELFIGALIGYAMGILLWAIAAVGDLMDVQAGFQNAQIFNPFSTQRGGPFGVLMTELGVLLFIGYGGLQVFLQLLFESLLLWPPASFTPVPSSAVRDIGIAVSGSLLETATRIAEPIIGVLLVVELGIGLINRAAQQLNTFYFSMPIKAVAAVLVLALLLSHLVDVVRVDIGESTGLLQRLDRAWRPR